MTFWVAIRNALLTCLTIAVIAGLVVADWYLRHAPARKAERILAGQGIPVAVDSAVAASGDGRIFMLEQLDLAGIDLGESNATGLSPLMAAVRSGETVAIDFLLSRDEVLANLDAPADEKGFRVLEAAMQDGDFGLAGRLIALGADPNAELEKNVPLLVQSCLENDRSTFDFLLNAGADPNRPDGQGITALVLAIANQDGDAIWRLLDRGADVGVTGITGEPILMEAVGRGDDDLAHLLLQFGAEPDQIGVSGATALIAAVQAGDIHSAEVLLDHGANPNGAGNVERVPLVIATDSQDVAAMNLLVQFGADANQKSLLLQTIRDRNVPGLKLLLDAGADPEVTRGDGVGALDVAVADGAMETVRALLEAGAGAEGRLWPALQSGHDEMVEMVLLHGADVGETDQDGNSPLDFALENERDKLVAIFLKRGADPNVSRSDGEPWLAAAIRTGQLGTARALLENGACIEGVACKDGHSLLGWAIARKQTELATRLIAMGADANAREPAPANEAFREQFSRSKTFRWHLQADSRISPLMLAAAQGDHDIAKALVEAGAKKGDYSRRYLWPVNIAAWHMDVPMMQIILGRDPDPDNQPRKLVVDLSQQRVTLYKNGRASYSSRVSTGKSGYRTKKGTFIISDKHRHHNSTIYGSSMPYFMRLSCDSFGLHQGNVPSYPASHGCIRVPYAGAKNLFYSCEVGDIVVIQE